MKVAVLGTGIMGTGVAHSLLREGHEVTVWNRNRARADALAGDGAQVAATPADAVQGRDAVLTVLFDATAVLEVMTPLAPALGETTWIQASTIGLEGTGHVVQLAQSHDLRLVEGQLLGTKQPAELGKLVILASGDPSLRGVAQQVFDAIGSRTLWAGDEVGKATAVKLACNAWIASITAATAQSLALAAGLGVDPQLFLDAIEGGAADSAYAHAKGAAMLDAAFEPSFAVNGLAKDLGLMLAGAERGGVDPSLLTALLRTYETAAKAGHGDDDIAAVYTAFTGH